MITEVSIHKTDLDDGTLRVTSNSFNETRWVKLENPTSRGNTQILFFARSNEEQTKIEDSLKYALGLSEVPPALPVDKSELAQAYRTVCKTHHESEGNLEFDDAAKVSYSENGGAYVQCWKWVDLAELPERFQTPACFEETK